MYAVCTDALNPTARPTPIKLAKLHHSMGARNVLFHDVRFYGYYHQLHAASLPEAVVLARESVPGDTYDDVIYAAAAHNYATALAAEPPQLWLIGNEPNADPSSESSWIMTPEEFAVLWNAAVPAIKSVIPDALCFVGGLLGGVAPDGSGWYDQVAPLLVPTPDGIDIHYPINEETLQGWQSYGLQLSCMEWCYTGSDVTVENMTEWLRILSFYTVHNGWFCASEGQFPSMGLWSAAGRERKAYHDLHNGLLQLLGGG